MTHPNNNPHLVAARARKAAEMIRNYVAARAEEDTPGHVIADELDLLADLWLMDVEAAACEYNAAEAVQAGRLKACSAATFEQAIKVAQAKANMLREAHAAVTRGRPAFTHREAQRASFLARVSETGNKFLTKFVAEQTAVPHENGELIYELPITVDLGHGVTVTIHPDNEWTRNVA